ncbi:MULTISPECIES: hypothetical protein [unclassified Oceanobacter]|uniref:hypothetical protein n=1 Tax=unclassified Oceanobacter TaxID=2620260 RepID=UPI0027325275|nr:MULTISPECIES: hypothetical protein [unclassified Oceanobacter]MDP2610223.1 hypothetical protein [Oceanobacter sp. 1_MG-2023]MDP2613489.1 hypothetical protein [Oceanobacter sp. 2_MG-2023]
MHAKSHFLKLEYSIKKQELNQSAQNPRQWLQEMKTATSAGSCLASREAGSGGRYGAEGISMDGMSMDGMGAQAGVGLICA